MNTILRWLGKLPVARFIKPLWKIPLRYLIQTQGDTLQASVKHTLLIDGNRAIDRNVDLWQKNVINFLGKLPIPASFRAVIGSIIQEHGDTLQGKLHKAIEDNGPAGVDIVFDTAQAALLAKIDSL